MNWNKITPCTNNFPKDYEQFKELTTKFIRDKFAKKEIKKNIPNKVLNNLLNVDTAIGTTVHYVKDIDFILDKDAFAEILKTIEEGYEFNPILTFHSTQNINKLNSIAKHGYLLPGETHPTKAYTLTMHTGNVYGDGIYSSPSFKCSTNYTFMDLNNDTKVIVNLLVMKKVKYVDPYDYSKKSQKSVPSLLFGETKYSDGSTVLINEPSNIFVACNKKYIIPIMLLTTTDEFKKTKMSQLAKVKPFNWFDLKHRVNQDNKYNVKMYHLFNDYYIISNDSNTLTKKQEYRHFFVFPIEYLNKNDIKKSFINFVKSFPNTHIKHLILFDDKAYLYKISNETIESLLNSIKITKSTNIYSALDKLMDFITNNNTDDYLNFSYVFCNHKSDKTLMDELISKYRPYYKFKSHTIKLIMGLDKTDGFSYVYLKDLETVHSANYDNWFYDMTTAKIEDIYDDILESYDNVITHKYSFNMSYPYGIIGEGFINGFTQDPLWDVQLDYSRNILYKGQYIEGLTYKTEGDNLYCGICDILPVEYIEDNQLMISAGCDIVIELLSKFRNEILKKNDTCKKYQNKMELLTKFFIDKINEQILKDNTDFAKLKGCLYKIQGLLSEIQTYGKITFSDKYFEDFKKIKYSKNIMSRVKFDFTDKLLELREQLKAPIKEPCQALAYWTNSNYGIKIRSSNGSMVEPWLIFVESVSNDKFTFNDLYKRIELNQIIKDSNNKKINAMLIDNFKTIGKLASGYTFTKNPYLYLGSQQTALMTVSLVYTIESIFRKARRYTKKDEDTAFDVLTKCGEKIPYLFGWIQNNLSKNDEATQLIKDLIANTQIENLITDSNNMASMCKLVGILSIPSAKTIFETKYKELCVATMAECVMRDCRVYLKNSKISEIDIFFKLFGLKNNTNVDTYVYSLETIAEKTNKFFNKKYSNCSPFAIVALLEFLEYYHTTNSSLDVKDIVKLYLYRTITMKKFLAKNYGETQGHIIQLALFIQGVKYNKSKHRQNIVFDPELIIKSTINECLETVKTKQQIKSSTTERNKNRLCKRIENAMIYRTYHTVPKLFSESEVFELNKLRPKKDQLELMLGGLLKHHCCYPDCPEYLKDQRTNFDKGINTHPVHDIICLSKKFTLHEIEELNKSREHGDRIKIDSDGYLVDRCDDTECPMYLTKLTILHQKHTREPNKFTHEEITKINRSRPNTDKITINHDGHLVNRCDVPECPMYLKKYTFNKKQETRHGIYKHLNPDIYNKNLLSGFHHNGILFKRSSKTYQEFVNKMKNKYNFVLDNRYETELHNIWTFSMYN